MNKYILILAFIAGASEVPADTVLNLHTVSYHEDIASQYNNDNYGFGIRHYNGINYTIFGMYKNSIRKQSFYVGRGLVWNYGDLDLVLTVGIITGYYQTMPLVLPSIHYKNVGLVIVPYPKTVLHLTIDIMRW